MTLLQKTCVPLIVVDKLYLIIPQFTCEGWAKEDGSHGPQDERAGEIVCNRSYVYECLENISSVRGQGSYCPVLHTCILSA